MALGVEAEARGGRSQDGDRGAAKKQFAAALERVRVRARRCKQTGKPVITWPSLFTRRSNGVKRGQISPARPGSMQAAFSPSDTGADW